MPNGADIRVFTPDGSNVRIQGVGDNRAPTTFGASLPFCLMDANARPLLNRAYRATAFVAILSALTTHAQDTIVIGTGTVENDFFSFPAPYGNAADGARHQMLIRADELQSAGMGPGNIYSVAFDVAQAAFVTFEGFTVDMGTTTQDDLSTGWVQGTSTVYGPTDFDNSTTGWNTHVFDTPWYWDGQSDLVVQTCFSNNDNAQNAFHRQSETSYTSTLVRSSNNPNVCFSQQFTPYTQRPNMRFTWAAVAPEAHFTQSTTATCGGTVTFLDASTGAPTGWQWDFGDGTTDSVPDPVHQYTSDGTFVPVLIVTNNAGSDTLEGAPITVNASGPRPVDACIPATEGSLPGIGIVAVTLNGSTYSSGDAQSEGWVDRSCILTTVATGAVLNMTVGTGNVAQHNIRGWIDWNGDGEFTGNELVLSADNQTSATGSVTVPVTAPIGTPLRMRFAADYSFSPYPQPCGPLQYGQAEDHGLLVTENTDPPVAGFSVTPSFTCDGTVQFTDQSLNVPTTWSWDFGDGGTSDEQSPAHTYSTAGTYTVTLIAGNSAGSDTETLENVVTVDLSGTPVPASCIPNTTAYCCGFGLLGFSFAGITSTSADGSEGYKDRTCGNTALLNEGAAYPISAITGGDVDHDVLVWIDLDNSGTFETSELIWGALGQEDPSGSVIIPAASAFGVPVRLRVTADVSGETTGPCEDPMYGQTEDFSAILSPNPDPPAAAFSATPTHTCTGLVQFTDHSLNAPDSWAWDFGDGSTSTEQSPLHQYDSDGTYSVSLTATNGNGSDTETANGLITVVPEALCDTLAMPQGPQGGSAEGCEGVLADDGGPNDDYSPGPGSPFTITAPNGQVVVLTFSQFEFETNFDVLRIFDGPDAFSNEIGDGFSGSGVDELPNNGVITSSGPSITLMQDASMGPTTWEGFLLNWSCSAVGINEEAASPIGNVYPQPARDRFTISFTAPTGNNWRLTLYDAVGAQVRTIDLDGGLRDRVVDTDGLAPGAYVMSVETPRGRWNRALILH